MRMWQLDRMFDPFKLAFGEGIHQRLSVNEVNHDRVSSTVR